MLPQALGQLARAANGLRPHVAESVPKGNRRRSFWQRFFFGHVREAFLAGDDMGYRLGVEKLLAGAEVPAVGRVTFISAGNGDPELLTLKAQRKLQEADVIVHDRPVSAAIVELARRDAVRIAVDANDFTAVSAILAREARAARHVVRLFSGAAPVEEQVAAAADGIAIEAVPGIEFKPQARILPFPVREDIREAVLRAAS